MQKNNDLTKVHVRMQSVKFVHKFIRNLDKKTTKIMLNLSLLFDII